MTVQPDPPESPYTPTFVKMFDANTGQTTLVPNMPGVLENHAARGWSEDIPQDEDVPEQPQVDSTGAKVEWAELMHPDLNMIHKFPNNSAAIAGAKQRGWVEVPAPEPETPDSGEGSEPNPEPAKKTASRKKTAADKDQSDSEKE